MSLDALVCGRLCGKPLSRSAKADAITFTTAKVRVSQANGETVYVSVIAFADRAKAALLALEYGDSVAITGELKVSIYTDNAGNVKPSLDLTAHALLTEYHLQRKYNAASDPADPVPLS